MSENSKIAWTDVPDFPGYSVSAEGAIRGKRGKVLRPGGKERPIVILYRDGISYARQVSHIVLEAFVGPRPFPEACALHENDDPWNNVLDNIRWGTRIDNKADERRNRGKVSGKPRRLATVPADDLFNGSLRAVAKRLGVCHSLVAGERRVRNEFKY